MLEVPVWNLVFSSGAGQVCHLLSIAKVMGGGGESESYVNLMLNEIQYVGDVCCD